MSTLVVEVDFGRLHPSGLIRKTGVEHELTKTSRRVTNFLVRLRTPSKKLWLASKVNQRTSTRSFPRPEMDALYKSDYSHRHRVQSCDICQNPRNRFDETCDLAKISTCKEFECSTANDALDVQRALTREFLDSTEAVRKCKVHFGIVASGSSVVKSARHRDSVCESTPGVVAFEMEGAGIWEVFPTIVVKGICNYADTHVDKRWQPLAAARAAVCAKALIAEWVLSEETVAR